eukprot:6229065-Pyramimonas_sp.AAC.1
MTDQSDVGSTGLFAQRTNQTPPPEIKMRCVKVVSIVLRDIYVHGCVQNSRGLLGNTGAAAMYHTWICSRLCPKQQRSVGHHWCCGNVSYMDMFTVVLGGESNSPAVEWGRLKFSSGGVA